MSGVWCQHTFGAASVCTGVYTSWQWDFLGPEWVVHLETSKLHYETFLPEKEIKRKIARQ